MKPAELEMLARLWRARKDTMQMSEISSIGEPLIFAWLPAIRNLAKRLDAA